MPILRTRRTKTEDFVVFGKDEFLSYIFCKMGVILINFGLPPFLRQLCIAKADINVNHGNSVSAKNYFVFY